MREFINRESTRLILFVVMWMTSSLMGASVKPTLTPEQVTQKAATLLTSSKGVSASFTIASGAEKTVGEIKCSGTKFYIKMAQMSTWYNGKSLYTYNPRTSETTIVDPSPQELVETNPLLYVRSGAGAYNCRFSKVRKAGKYVIELTPKQKSSIRKLVFTINSGNYHIEKITVDASSGSTTVDVTSLKTGLSFAASTFDYPKSLYPKAEIVDLR